MSQLRSKRARGVNRLVKWLSTWVNEDLVKFYLVGSGTLYVLMGLTWVFVPSRGRELGVAWVPAMTAPSIGILWIVSGVIAGTIGALGYTRTNMGFQILQYVPALLIFTFSVSWLYGILPPHDGYGNAASINSIVSFTTIWFLTYLPGIAWARVREDRRLREEAEIRAKRAEVAEKTLQLQILALTKSQVAERAEEAGSKSHG